VPLVLQKRILLLVVLIVVTTVSVLFVATLEGMCYLLVQSMYFAISWYSRGTVLIILYSRGTALFVVKVDGLL
jgi:hypothetical protein